MRIARYRENVSSLRFSVKNSLYFPLRITSIRGEGGPSIEGTLGNLLRTLDHIVNCLICSCLYRPDRDRIPVIIPRSNLEAECRPLLICYLKPNLIQCWQQLLAWLTGLHLALGLYILRASSTAPTGSRFPALNDYYYASRKLRSLDIQNHINSLDGLQLDVIFSAKRGLGNFVTGPERQLPIINNHNRAVNNVFMAAAEQKELTAKTLFYLSIRLDINVLMFW